jgi:hypothetical protein
MIVKNKRLKKVGMGPRWTILYAKIFPTVLYSPFAIAEKNEKTN